MMSINLNSKHPKRAGFTFIELLVAISILGLMGTMIASIYFSQFGVFSRQSGEIDTKTTNTIAIDEIVNQVKESEAVSQCALDSTWVAHAYDCVFSLLSVTHYSSANKLVLRAWPLDSNKEPFDPYQTQYTGAFCDPNGSSRPSPLSPPCIYDAFIYFKDHNNNLIKRRVSVTTNYSTRSSRLPVCDRLVCKSTDKILIRNVESIFFQYQYFDAAGNPVPVTLNGTSGEESLQATVTTVIIKITTQSKPIKGPPVTTVTTRRATIRNK